MMRLYEIIKSQSFIPIFMMSQDWESGTDFNVLNDQLT